MSEEWIFPRLSKNFNASEFACKCGCGFGMKPGDIDPRLVAGLQQIRTWLGAPIIINSGCRCPAHNAAIKGSPNSQHVEGKAADVRGAPIGELQRMALQIPMFVNGGIGRYGTFLHLDVRGYKARW